MASMPGKAWSFRGPAVAGIAWAVGHGVLVDRAWARRA